MQMDAATALRDFPDKLAPVFVRDLRQGLRSQVLVWAFLVIQATALMTLLIDWGLARGFDLGSIGIAVPSVFLGVVGTVFSLLLPLTQFGALQSELGRGRNIELLLCSQLSRWQIVRGKFFVACSLSGLLLISLVPFLLIRYFIGGVELVENVSQVAALWMGNATMNAIVIGASGFANYITRGFVILLASIAHTITVATVPVVVGFAGTVSVPTAGYFAAFAGAIPFLLLGLQLGRSRLRIFENPEDPPATGVVLILIFCLPILHGIAIAAGGLTGSVAILAGVSVLALLIDRGPGRRKQLKGAQP